jgi:hypothetical protein
VSPLGSRTGPAKASTSCHVTALLGAGRAVPRLITPRRADGGSQAPHLLAPGPCAISSCLCTSVSLPK